MNITAQERILLNKRAELTAGMPDWKSIEVERLPDVLDEMQSRTDREIAVVSIHRHWSMVKAINAALERLAQGNYEKCEECGGTIHSKRLQALPWASRCRDCQELWDAQALRSNGAPYEEALAS